ncbi:hypothetical protein B296_00057033 [Ensete ventricosum]|uniref:Uncharacterized protein n=1 Tax=Ensete ventricosum TaxID=4639 RepID=A0A426XSW0_ENSVE|nr:hypothetical protein B296_00057033 [Ensete ventricosum]
MAVGCIVVEAITSSSIKSLLPSSASYACSLSNVGDKLRSFRSYLKWMYVDQFDARHTMVSRSLFLLDIFVLTIFHFTLSYAPTHRAYDMMVQLFLTFVFSTSYLCFSTFVRRYNILM